MMQNGELERVGRMMIRWRGAPIPHLVPFYGFSLTAFATDHQTRQSGDFSHCNEHLLPDFLQIVRNNPDFREEKLAKISEVGV